MQATTKFALINTFNALPGCLGCVESFHRTVEAAEAADRRLQRAVKRANGEASYLPTEIREVAAKAPRDNQLHQSWLADA